MNKPYGQILLTFAMACTLLILSATNAHAVFLLLQEVSAESVGQANMLTAYGQRPSSQYHNSSNLSFIDEDFTAEIAFTMYIPIATYTNPSNVSTTADVEPEYAPHVYLSFKPTEWMAIGLAAFPNYGIITRWPDNWEGEYVVKRNSVKSFTVNPNISFGPFKGFAISAGFDATWSAISTTRVFTLGMVPDGDDGDGSFKMAGQGWAFGGNAGLSYQPADWVRMGLGYRSKFKLAFEGSMDFDVSEPWEWRFPDQDFDLGINVPHQVSFGARFWPMENLSVEIDAWYFSWSVHESRDINMEEGVYEAPDKTRMVDAAPQNLKDGFLIGVGSEYWFHENVCARLGISYSSNVQPDEAVDPVQPDGHRINIGVGFGYKWKGLNVDLAYLLGYIVPHDVSVPSAMPGEYENLKHVLSFSIGYQFDIFGHNDAAKTVIVSEEEIN